MTTAAGPVGPGRWRRWVWHHPEWGWTPLCAAGWVVIVFSGHAGMDHPLALWPVMVVATMVPPALPMVRYVASASRWRRRHRSAAVFLAGELSTWTAAGLVVVPAAALAGSLPDGFLMTVGLAGLWELTTAKKRFLRRCHWTDPLPPDGWRADAACFRFGIRYGRDSLGAGWALMLLMVVAGHEHLVLMALLAVIAAAEELLAKGTELTRAAAVAVVGVGILAAAAT
jgi:predicted metal-binding membrane protein